MLDEGWSFKEMFPDYVVWIATLVVAVVAVAAAVVVVVFVMAFVKDFTMRSCFILLLGFEQGPSDTTNLGSTCGL